MKIYTVFIQRTQLYTGQFLPELVAAIDENGNADNPDYIIKELEKWQADAQRSCSDIDAAEIIILDLPELTWEKIQAILGRDSITIRSGVSIR